MGLWSGDCWTLSEDRPMAYDLEDFEEVIAELAAAEENPEVDAAWAILKEAARTDRASRRRHARQVNSPDHLGNRVIDAAVLIGFGACLAVAAGAFWNWQLGLNWFGLNRLDPNWLGLNWF
jgi:ferric-dicitrate binding protein FerR (iron transport regulator)